MINDILHAVLCCQAAAAAAAVDVVVVVLQAFLRAIHFHSVHKTSSQSRKKKIYICWPGGKNIDTETETENEKIKKNQKEKP